MGEGRLQTSNPFAVILLTSLKKDQNLKEADSWLVTTIARAKNTGMEYDQAKEQLLAKGSGPVLMEAVNTRIEFEGRKPKFAYVLDHAGKRTREKIKPKGNILNLDGSTYKAISYEIVF